MADSCPKARAFPVRRSTPSDVAARRADIQEANLRAALKAAAAASVVVPSQSAGFADYKLQDSPQPSSRASEEPMSEPVPQSLESSCSEHSFVVTPLVAALPEEGTPVVPPRPVLPQSPMASPSPKHNGVEAELQTRCRRLEDEGFLLRERLVELEQAEDASRLRGHELEKKCAQLTAESASWRQQVTALADKAEMDRHAHVEKVEHDQACYTADLARAREELLSAQRAMRDSEADQARIQTELSAAMSHKADVERAEREVRNELTALMSDRQMDEGALRASEAAQQTLRNELATALAEKAERERLEQQAMKQLAIARADLEVSAAKDNARHASELVQMQSTLNERLEEERSRHKAEIQSLQAAMDTYLDQERTKLQLRSLQDHKHFAVAMARQAAQAETELTKARAEAADAAALQLEQERVKYAAELEAVRSELAAALAAPPAATAPAAAARAPSPGEVPCGLNLGRKARGPGPVRQMSGGSDSRSSVGRLAPSSSFAATGRGGDAAPNACGGAAQPRARSKATSPSSASRSRSAARGSGSASATSAPVGTAGGPAAVAAAGRKRSPSRERSTGARARSPADAHSHAPQEDVEILTADAAEQQVPSPHLEQTNSQSSLRDESIPAVIWSGTKEFDKSCNRSDCQGSRSRAPDARNGLGVALRRPPGALLRLRCESGQPAQPGRRRSGAGSASSASAAGNSPILAEEAFQDDRQEDCQASTFSGGSHAVLSVDSSEEDCEYEEVEAERELLWAKPGRASDSDFSVESQEPTPTSPQEELDEFEAELRELYREGALELEEPCPCASGLTFEACHYITLGLSVGPLGKIEEGEEEAEEAVGCSARHAAPASPKRGVAATTAAPAQQGGGSAAAALSSPKRSAAAPTALSASQPAASTGAQAAVPAAAAAAASRVGTSPNVGQDGETPPAPSTPGPSHRTVMPMTMPLVATTPTATTPPRLAASAAAPAGAALEQRGGSCGCPQPPQSLAASAVPPPGVPDLRGSTRISWPTAATATASCCASIGGQRLGPPRAMPWPPQRTVPTFATAAAAAPPSAPPPPQRCTAAAAAAAHNAAAAACVAHAQAHAHAQAAQAQVQAAQAAHAQVQAQPLAAAAAAHAAAAAAAATRSHAAPSTVTAASSPASAVATPAATPSAPHVPAMERARPKAAATPTPTRTE